MLPENTTHSFVIKMWLEDTANDRGQTVWRGHVTHIPSHRRYHFDNFDNLRQFIQAYLKVSDPDDPTSEF